MHIDIIKMILVSGAFAMTLPTTAVQASALSDAAENLQPGEWVVFETQGYEEGLLDLL